MFLGHFGLAFAAKKVAPEVSLGTAIFAAEFLDAVWPLLVLAGVERVVIAPGITRVTPLDFVHYPWSHSLAMALAWAAAFGLAYWGLRRRLANALWLAALVVSHWFLDWIAHRPDLPLYPGDPGRYGLGLWNSMPLTMAAEFGLLAVGLAVYARATRARDRIGKYALAALVLVLVASYLGATFGPPPPSPEAVALSGLAGYAMVAWGWWIDRHREPAGR
ncbi:MAG: metal-dependent hydrolase [Usitatibacter sp.]